MRVLNLLSINKCLKVNWNDVRIHQVVESTK